MYMLAFTQKRTCAHKNIDTGLPSQFSIPLSPSHLCLPPSSCRGLDEVSGTRQAMKGTLNSFLSVLADSITPLSVPLSNLAVTT